MNIEMQIKGRLIEIGAPGQQILRLWNNVYPGQVDLLTGWSYEELFKLGAGVHNIEPDTSRPGQ